MNDERPDEVPPLITRRIRSGAVVAAGLLVVLAVVPAVLLGADQAGAVLLGVLGWMIARTARLPALGSVPS